MKTLTISHTSRAAVKFRCDIIDAKTGRTVKRGIEQSNLLFDYGLDNLADRYWLDLFAHFAIGTGTTPTRRDSGVVKFSRSGTTITADGSFFEAADTGRLLKWDTGEECYLTYVNGTTAASNVSGTVAAAEGTIYYVNRNSLGAEVKRTNVLTSDAGDHGRSYNGTTGVLSTWKTMLFSAETGTVTYKEIGWSHLPSGNPATINGAALIAGGGDTLVSGQQYKVKLQLDRVISPRVARPLAASSVVDLWTGTANEVLESMHFSCWNTSGQGDSPATYATMDPGTGVSIQLSTDTTPLRPLPSISSAVTRSGFGGEKPVVFDAYVAGSFSKEGVAVWEATEGNSTDIRGVFISVGGGWCSQALLFDTPQTKLSSQKLRLRFRKSWGRVLVN